MKNIFALILLISLLPASGYSEEVVSKKYFVKGMTCGGCILAGQPPKSGIFRYTETSSI